MPVVCTRVAILLGAIAVTSLQAQPGSPLLPPSATAADSRAVLNQYCSACHNAKLNTAGLALESLDIAQPAARADKWEQVVRRLRTSTMPPRGMPRPDQAAYDAVAGWLESEIDKDAAAHPNPGRSNTVHRG